MLKQFKNSTLAFKKYLIFNQVFNATSYKEIVAWYYPSWNPTKNISFECYWDSSRKLIRFSEGDHSQKKAWSSPIFDKNGPTLWSRYFLQRWFNAFEHFDSQLRPSRTDIHGLFWTIMYVSIKRRSHQRFEVFE